MKTVSRVCAFVAVTMAWLASTLGIVSAAPIVQNTSQEAIYANSPLVLVPGNTYAEQVKAPGSNVQQLYHYSHSSHQSHYSHQSHVSHYSSYYN